jgi:hypothetical protein
MYILFAYRNPEEAVAFIIPFDAGVHSYIDHITGKPRLASPYGWHAISLLKEASNNEVPYSEMETVCLSVCPQHHFVTSDVMIVDDDDSNLLCR